MRIPVPEARLALLVLAIACAACTDDPDPAAYCAAARDAAAADLPGAFARFDPTAPEASRDEMAAAITGLADLRDAAAGEVRDDLSTLVSVGDDLVDALGDLATDPDGVRERIDGMADRFAEADTASQRVVRATLEACGVDLAAPTAPVATTVATTTSTP